MLISFPGLSKFMADTHSDKVSSLNPEATQPSRSETSDLFNVFPDCLIMWDDNDSTKESQTPSPDISRAAQSPVQQPHHQSVPPYSSHLPSAALNTNPGQDQHPVQYHVHYHPRNGNRQIAVFLSGGVIFFLGFLLFYFKPPLPDLLDNNEPSEQAQAVFDRLMM
ncbi:MAG: hypothetical protein AAF327_23970 [Cyanobacteria bacterium P01_A01_bin.37]